MWSKKQLKSHPDCSYLFPSQQIRDLLFSNLMRQDTRERPWDQLEFLSSIPKFLIFYFCTIKSQNPLRGSVSSSVYWGGGKNKLGPFYEWTFLYEMKFTNIIILTFTNINTNICQCSILFFCKVVFIDSVTDHSLKALTGSNISLWVPSQYMSHCISQSETHTHSGAIHAETVPLAGWQMMSSWIASWRCYSLDHWKE